MHSRCSWRCCTWHATCAPWPRTTTHHVACTPAPATMLVGRSLRSLWRWNRHRRRSCPPLPLPPPLQRHLRGSRRQVIGSLIWEVIGSLIWEVIGSLIWERHLRGSRRQASHTSLAAGALPSFTQHSGASPLPPPPLPPPRPPRPPRPPATLQPLAMLRRTQRRRLRGCCAQLWPRRSGHPRRRCRALP